MLGLARTNREQQKKASDASIDDTKELKIVFGGGTSFFDSVESEVVVVNVIGEIEDTGGARY